MNIYVAHAAPIPQEGTPVPPEGTPLRVPSEVREAALPEGFPFLVEGDTGEIIEPVLLWMCAAHLSGGRRSWVRNTAQGQADALKDFWIYLAAAEVAWSDVDENDLAHYRDAMRGLVSRKTHEPLSDKTVRLRLTHVLAFYDWTRKMGHYKGAEFSKKEVRRCCPVDEDAFAHARGGSQARKRAAVLPDARGRPGDEVRPFGRADLQRVLRALGPLPSEREADGIIVDPRPSRDRLAAEMGVVAGMRVDEIGRLPAYAVLDLCPSDWKSHDLGPAVTLFLRKTKGLVQRSVQLPTWLIYELDLYIRGERATALEKATMRKTAGGKKPASVVFVNGLLAGTNVGRDVKAGTIQAAFHRAVVDSGVVRRVLKTDPDTGEQRLKQAAKHSFHDLRHTFAVQTYLEERRRGNAEPWKVVQSRLGHRHLATTLNYYLRVVEAEEAVVSDALWAQSRSIASGEDA